MELGERQPQSPGVAAMELCLCTYLFMRRCFLPQKERLTRNPPTALSIIRMEKARKGARTSGI